MGHPVYIEENRKINRTLLKTFGYLKFYGGHVSYRLDETVGEFFCRSLKIRPLQQTKSKAFSKSSNAAPTHTQCCVNLVCSI